MLWHLLKPFFVLLPFVVGCFFCPWDDFESRMFIFIGLPVVVLGVCLFVSLRLSYCVRSVEVDGGRILLDRYTGGTLVLSDIQDVVIATKEEFDEHTTYEVRGNERYGLDTTQYGLSLKEISFNSSVYGKFTRISNNLDELALVILWSGEKYLINYPHELLTEEAIDQLCRRKKA